jgi:zinc transporter ZupT
LTLIEYILLFLSVVLGGGIAFYLRKNNKAILSLVLSFSGAYILGITVLHLMPGTFHNASSQQGLFVLLGFCIQLFLEQFSGGVEHGHMHAHKGAGGGFAVSIMIGLCVHAFMEGMPLGTYENFHEHTHGHTPGHNHLLLGIILHKAPAAFALVLLLLMSGFSKKIVWLCLLFFAVMSPLGGIIGEYAQFTFEMQQIVVAVVVGSFLHISTTIIFEADGGSHKILGKKLIAIIGGMGMALLTLI